MKKDKVLAIVEELEKKYGSRNPFIVEQTMNEIEKLISIEENNLKFYSHQEYVIYFFCVLLYLFPLFQFSFLLPLVGFIPLLYLAYKANKKSKRYQLEWKIIRRLMIEDIV
jgi:hypothetical protein